MTQPPLPLSQTTHALESNLDTQLFRDIALTPAGLAVLPEAQRLPKQTTGLSDLVRRAASGESGLLIPPLSDKEKLALDYLPVLSEPLVLAAAELAPGAAKHGAGLR